MKKEVLAGILTAAMTMSVFGSVCAFAESETPTIAFVPKVTGQAWWDHVQENVEEWAADEGIDVIYKGPTDTDAAAQVQIMTDLVNQGVDILCFSPNDPDACEEICKEAMEKGIVVIATEASGMENVTYDVEAFDETGLGGFLMDQLAEQMGEEGEYITMVGSMTMESQNNWADAAVARAEDAYPKMTLVDDKRVADDSDAEKAYELTKELLQKYPNQKGILRTGSFDAPGAARAIQELGLTSHFKNYSGRSNETWNSGNLSGSVDFPKSDCAGKSGNQFRDYSRKKDCKQKTVGCNRKRST